MDGVKELTKSPLMQANSKVLSPPIPLHPGSLHFDTLLKLQITHFSFFGNTKAHLEEIFLPRRQLAHAQLLGAGRQNLESTGVLFI